MSGSAFDEHPDDTGDENATGHGSGEPPRPESHMDEGHEDDRAADRSRDGDPAGPAEGSEVSPALGPQTPRDPSSSPASDSASTEDSSPASGSSNPLQDALGAMFGGDVAKNFDLGDLSSLGGIGGDFAPAKIAEGLGADPAMLSQMFAQVQAMMSGAGSDGSAINWKLAQEGARAKAAGDDPSVSETAEREVHEAFRLAQLWVDEATTLSASGAQVHALSRAEWVERTLPTWKELAEPVAASMSAAMAENLSQQAPTELQAMMAGAGQMLRSVGGSIYGMQLGQAVGTLAGSVLISTEIGFPLLEEDGALVPVNVESFAEDAAVPVDEARLYLAAQEEAHLRLFAHARWLKPHVLALVADYARGVSIDSSRLEDLASQFDMSDPTRITEALSSGVFEIPNTEAQKNALVRLETVLALIEGWVDEVSYAATANLPSRDALRESIRRRRATGGPAESTFATLVGLDLRPRRLRDAATLFAHMAHEDGAEARDGVWAHPDLLPTTKDLDDPLGYKERHQESQDADSAVDAALEQLLKDAENGLDPRQDPEDPTAGLVDEAEPEDPESGGPAPGDGPGTA